MYDSQEVILEFHLLVAWWDLSAGKPKSDDENSEVVSKEWQNMVWILNFNGCPACNAST